MTLRQLLQVLISPRNNFAANGEAVIPINPEIARTLKEVRKQAHEIANKAATTHALVEKKHRAVRLAEEALALANGED